MATCRSCDAEIEWVENEKSGKNMPLDLDPAPGGNIVIVGRKAGSHGMVNVARYVGAGKGTRTSHFATCPEADSHRRR